MIKNNQESKESIGHAIGITMNLIGRVIAQDIKNEKNLKISPIQIEIMKYLTKNIDKKTYQKDLETIFTIRKSIKEDQRIKEIVLTEDALHKLDSVKKKINKIDAVMTKNIAEKDLVVFYQVMHQLQNNLINFR